MAALRPVPNITLASPMNEHELRRLMYTAQLPGKGTFVIRYPRGRGVLADWHCPLEEVKVGTGRKLRDGDDIAVLSVGPVGNNVVKAVAASLIMGISTMKLTHVLAVVLVFSGVWLVVKSKSRKDIEEERQEEKNV